MALRHGILVLALFLLFYGCGDGEELSDEPFVLEQVPVSELMKQGMEKEIIGDTIIARLTPPVRDTAHSSDGSKSAWCEDGRVVVYDNASGEQVILHEEEAPAGVALCYQPSFSDDGLEIHFYQLIDDPISDSSYQKTRVIIALGESE